MSRFFELKKRYWEQNSGPSYSGDKIVVEFLVDSASGLTYTGCVYGTVTVDWGDGSPEETIVGKSYSYYTNGTALTHTYASYGTYTVIFHSESLIAIRNSYASGITFAGTRMWHKILYWKTPAWVKGGDGRYSFRNIMGTATAEATSVAIDYVAPQVFDEWNAMMEDPDWNASRKCLTFGIGCASMSLAAFSFVPGLQYIPDNFVYGFSQLVDIDLPDTLIGIDGGAFRGCTNLAMTTLPSGITSIGNDTFRGCTNLAMTTLPSGITSIGNRAFMGCTNLALTALPSGITSIGTSAFSGCKSLSLTSLPDTVTSIGQTAFYNAATPLASLPSQLASVGVSAFEGCSGCTFTDIPASVATLANKAFGGIWKNKAAPHAIVFKGTPTTISESAFFNNAGITDIYVPWSEGDVAGAPWGATNATITYNYTS